MISSDIRAMISALPAFHCEPVLGAILARRRLNRCPCLEKLDFLNTPILNSCGSDLGTSLEDDDDRVAGAIIVSPVSVLDNLP